MKKSIFLLSSTILIFSSGLSVADDQDIFNQIPGEFSGSVSILSDYTFRGISQTDENPAIQGSIDYSADLGNDIGLYLGTWASNVDFNDNSEASSEFDHYGGLTYAYDKFSFDAGIIYYNYPGAANGLDYNFIEYQGAVGYDFGFMNAKASINWSPDYFADSGHSEYYKLAIEAPLSYGINFDAHIARQNVEDNVAFANPDYTDWSVGLSREIKGLDFKIQYIDTSISKRNCADACDSRAVLTISRSF